MRLADVEGLVPKRILRKDYGHSHSFRTIEEREAYNSCRDDLSEKRIGLDVEKVKEIIGKETGYMGLSVRSINDIAQALSDNLKEILKCEEK